MQVLIFVIVLIGILVCIAAGVWVAIALVGAISTRRRMTTQQHHANGETEN
jgi:uncharacterized membrane protein